jgi:hypothetical protein
MIIFCLYNTLVTLSMLNKYGFFPKCVLESCSHHNLTSICSFTELKEEEEMDKEIKDERVDEEVEDNDIYEIEVTEVEEEELEVKEV